MGTTTMMILGILLFLAGLWVFLSGSKKDQQEHAKITNKDELPVLPRDQRVRPTIVNEGDALSNLAAAATMHDHDLSQSRFGFGDKPTESKPTEKVAELTGALPTNLPSQNTPAYLPSDVSQPEPQTESQSPVQSSNTIQAPTTPIFDASSLEVDNNVAVYDEKLAQKVAQDALQQFDGDATVLDQHLHGQEAQNTQNQAPTQAISLFIRPKDGLGVSGQTILRLAQDYAMKYGVSNMFHRYENADGTGEHWFSMLGLTHESIADFDLVALPTQNFNGLALFMSLPHPQPLQGFDSMVAITKSMAAELDADIFNENWEKMESPQLLAMRNLVMG